MKEDARLKSLQLKNFRNLDQPIDRCLLERVATKLDSFTLGAMPELKDDVRASMTECIASFFAASENLKDVDVSHYIESNQEAVTIARALRQSESITSI